jgi:hypothetical protein
MTQFQIQADAIIKALEAKSKESQNFAELEIHILEATQKFGQAAANTLETKASEGISPLET